MANHAHNQRADFRRKGPIGVVTRGTTNTNRLRRTDRWMVSEPSFRDLLLHVDHPLAVDVGYGASHTTTCEWARWLRQLRSDISVIGLEIDPARVLDPVDGVEFRLGGFELAGLTPHVVRAFNVLRQYDVDQVWPAWQTVTSAMHPDGLFLEGTCDEIGRRSTWIVLDKYGPKSLTLCWDPRHSDVPSQVAERLPKVLIHRNVEGYRIHEVLKQLDQAWVATAGHAPFGLHYRWKETVSLLRNSSLEVRSPRRSRDCIVTLPWDVVADDDIVSIPGFPDRNQHGS